MSAQETIDEAAPPSLSAVAVDRLFGLFDHKIELHRGEGVTIIHGANGVGKTRILQLLASLPRLRLGALRRTPFERLMLHFSAGESLEVFREGTARSADDAVDADEVPTGSDMRDLRVVLTSSDGETFHADIPQPGARDTRGRLREAMRFVDMELPFLTRIGPDEWIHDVTGEAMTVVDIVDEFGDVLPPPLRALKEELPQPIEEFLRSLRIDFIDTQRLTMRGAGLERSHRHLGQHRPIAPMERTVELYAEDLRGEIDRYLTEYADISAQLDRTFPQRALSQYGSGAESESIRDQYEQLTALRERLTTTGILERGDELPWPDRALDETERRFLALSLEDTRRKLAVFEKLLSRLELLADVLDQRFLLKRTRIDRRRGFYFTSAYDDQVLPSQLSSGEQHEVVFAYRLLFKTRAASLVLIDEPEISLNVAWQQKFLNDLLRIRELSDLGFLIATHSPQIIHDRWDLAQRLGGGIE